MEKIAALVEGHTEEHFVRATYGAAQIARPFPNGKDVELKLIVEAIVDALEIMSGSISKVLILLDRERRPISATALANALLTALTQKCAIRRFYIGVADRQIENWIIADEQEMQERFDPNFSYSGDGCGGKQILQELNKGISLAPYDTALLLKDCSAARAGSKSPSLMDLLNTIDFGWTWAKN